MRATILACAVGLAPALAAAQTQGVDLPPPPPAPASPYASPGPPNALAPYPYAVPPYGYAQPYARPRPRYIPYEDGAPVPPGARVVTRPRYGLIIAGSSMLGASWLLSLTIGGLASAGSSDHDEGLWMVVPVVGPFAYLATLDDPPGVVWFGLTFLGLVQVTGATLLVVGAANPGRYLVYDGVARARPRWAISPGAPGGYGATFSMTF